MAVVTLATTRVQPVVESPVEASPVAAIAVPVRGPSSPAGALPWETPTRVTYAGRGAARRCRRGSKPSTDYRVGGIPSPRRAAPPVSRRSASPRRRAASAERLRSRPLARRVATRVLLGVPGAFGLALLLAISLPVLFGCRSLVVMSGSMAPALPTGSVVVVKRIPADAIAVGDVISFRNPEDGRVLTHRVQGVAVEGGPVEVETRGDANTGSESWTIEPVGTVGRLVFHVPHLGYLLAPLQGAAPRLLLVVLPALLLAGLLLADIWRPQARAGRRRVGLDPSPVRSCGA